MLVLRSVYLLLLFTPAVLMAPLADSLGPRFRKLWLRVVHASLEQAGEEPLKWSRYILGLTYACKMECSLVVFQRVMFLMVCASAISRGLGWTENGP